MSESFIPLKTLFRQCYQHFDYYHWHIYLDHYHFSKLVNTERVYVRCCMCFVSSGSKLTSYIPRKVVSQHITDHHLCLRLYIITNVT